MLKDLREKSPNALPALILNDDRLFELSTSEIITERKISQQNPQQLNPLALKNPLTEGIP